MQNLEDYGQEFIFFFQNGVLYHLNFEEEKKLGPVYVY